MSFAYFFKISNNGSYWLFIVTNTCVYTIFNNFSMCLFVDDKLLEIVSLD